MSAAVCLTTFLKAYKFTPKEGKMGARDSDNLLTFHSEAVWTQGNEWLYGQSDHDGRMQWVYIVFDKVEDV